MNVDGDTCAQGVHARAADGPRAHVECGHVRCFLPARSDSHHSAAGAQIDYSTAPCKISLLHYIDEKPRVLLRCVNACRRDQFIRCFGISGCHSWAFRELSAASSQLCRGLMPAFRSAKPAGSVLPDLHMGTPDPCRFPTSLRCPSKSGPPRAVA